MQIQRDGYKFTIVTDSAKEAESLEVLLQALEVRGPFRKGKVTIGVELDFDAPGHDEPPAAKPKPKAKAKAKAK